MFSNISTNVAGFTTAWGCPCFAHVPEAVTGNVQRRLLASARAVTSVAAAIRSVMSTCSRHQILHVHDGFDNQMRGRRDVLAGDGVELARLDCGHGLPFRLLE